MTIDVSSIGIKFKNFMQAGCRDLGLYLGRTLYCRKPIILPKLVLFFWNILRITSTPFHYLWQECEKIVSLNRKAKCILLFIPIKASQLLISRSLLLLLRKCY